MHKCKGIILPAIISLLVIDVLYAKDAFSAKDTISVLYFDNTTKNTEYAWLSKGIADMLISDIVNLGVVDVVERENLKNILNEHELSMTGLVDDKKALELGKLLSANKLIYGSYIIQGNTLVINGKLTETEKGKITATFSVKGAPDKFLSLQNDLTLKVQKALKIEPEGLVKTAPEYSFQAVKTYYQGLDLLDKGAVEDARKKFEESSKIDPQYLKPYQGIEESYKYLKDFTKMRQQREIAKLYGEVIKFQNRLKETPWRTFAEIARTPYYVKLVSEEKNICDKKEVWAYCQCNTPAVCNWRIQTHLLQLALLYVQYFNDVGKATAIYKEIISITDKSRKTFAKDPFFSEILSIGLTSAVQLGDWREVKKRSEEIMSNYPDYRMIAGVEDFYKRALENLSKDKGDK